jgi:hypothetical protein
MAGRRSKVAIDPELLERAVAVCGETAVADALTKAQRDLDVFRAQQRLVELFGTLDWIDDEDPERTRPRG